MAGNIAKSLENVSREVRRTGVTMRRLSAGASRPHVVECAFKSPLRAREEGRLMTPASLVLGCEPSGPA
jgi:hypothetical protein